MKKLYLIDISSLFFRSYYAISLNMKNEKGDPTNALYGVFKMLHKLMKQKSPDYLVSCFDTKQVSFRKEIYPEYKSNRGEMPEDLEQQVPYLKIMMEVLKIPYIEKPGFEADDIIGTLAFHGKKQKLDTYIISGDKDFAQLVGKNTFLYDTMKDVIYDIQGVKNKWGVFPEQMLDYLSLIGDSSDNIPGVRGIGPKGAVTLLEKYKTLEKIYKNIDHISGATQKKLIGGEDLAYLSKKLISLRTDMKISLPLKEAVLEHPHQFSRQDQKRLKEFLEELSFKSFIQMFFPEKASLDKVKSKQVSKSANPLKGVIKKEEFLEKLEPYASLWLGSQEDHMYLASKKMITLLEVSDYIEAGKVLDEKWVRYCGYNLKSSWKKLNCLKPVAEWDAMVAGHLLDSKPSRSFKDLCYLHLKSTLEDSVSIDEIYKLHQSLRLKLEEKLNKLKLEEVLKDIEIPIISVLYRMEQRGLLLDIKEVERQSKELKEDIQKIEKKIFNLVGEEFNLSSPKQLSVILFENLKLPKGRKTKSGYSTDSHELIKMKNLHPSLPFIIEHRELFKLKTTYTDSLLSLVNPETKRIHTQFRQTATSTGRLSSVNPNLQNIPIRTERGREIRKCFIAPQGSKIISADYSQIELRILAHITKDPGLIKAFENDLDIHAATASEIFNISLKNVTVDLRRKGKAVNFGIAYGQGVYGLAEGLGISRQEAREIIDNYFKKFKQIKDYIETIKEESFKKGYVETLFGRKRFFDKSEFKNPRLKAAVERAAINAPLQGSASDLVKKAMIQLDESLPIPLLSQVHDELLFECPEDCIEFESQEIVSIMEQSVTLRVPLKVNISIGQNWNEAH